VLSLDGSVSLVVSIAVVDVTLVIGVHSLVGEFIVVTGGDVVKALVSEPRADHSGGEEVSVVETHEATGEISPRKTHFYILLRIIIIWLIKTITIGDQVSERYSYFKTPF
jgi:hypothetical protein